LEVLRLFKLGEAGIGCKILVEKPEAKRPFGRPRRTWEDNIKIDLTGLDVSLWTDFNWLRVGFIGADL
jgi:hypothetical protein